MAFLFVPLTTLAIQDLKRREIWQGTGLNNMGRQLGGSFGIAALTTLIHIRNGIHRSNLLSNINEYNNSFTQKINLLTQSFIAKGYTYLYAKKAAMKAIDGMITKQTFLLTYTDAYWLVGYIMLFSIPFLLLQKHNKNIFIPTDSH